MQVGPDDIRRNAMLQLFVHIGRPQVGLLCQCLLTRYVCHICVPLHSCGRTIDDSKLHGHKSAIHKHVLPADLQYKMAVLVGPSF